MSRMDTISGRPTQKIPRLGTKLRATWDTFQENKCVPLSIYTLGLGNTGNRRALTDLTDYYGLDIRHHSRFHYWLVGEWHGDQYHDYLANTVRDTK